MIDINELRRLAQAATPGPWQFWHGWVAANIDNDGGVVVAERPTPSGGKYQAKVDANFKFIAAANPAAINELLDRLEAAESDGLEQARLNGMGGEREAALLSKLEAAGKERDALRAKIEQMEKQEPAAWMGRGPRDGRIEFSVDKPSPSVMRDFNMTPLYALPGTQSAPSLRVEQDELVRKSWARFSNELHRSPDAPYPGMSEAFEQHFSQSFTDRDWRAESGTWAAAWKAAKRHGTQPAPSGPDEAAAYSEWFHGERGVAYDGMWAFAKAAWLARAALAASPEAKP